LQARLEYYYQFDEIKGFRHIVQGEAYDFLLDPGFCRGISLLEQYNFTYDILIYPEHLPCDARIRSEISKTVFVIDHLAKRRDQKARARTLEGIDDVNRKA